MRNSMKTQNSFEMKKPIKVNFILVENKFVLKSMETNL